MEHQFWYDIERDETLTDQEKKAALKKRMDGLCKVVQQGKANPWLGCFQG